MVATILGDVRKAIQPTGKPEYIMTRNNLNTLVAEFNADSINYIGGRGLIDAGDIVKIVKRFGNATNAVKAWYAADHSPFSVHAMDFLVEAYDIYIPTEY